MEIAAPDQEIAQHIKGFYTFAFVWIKPTKYYV